MQWREFQLEFVVILESSSKPCLESITESIRECCLSVQVLHSNQQGYEEEMFAVLFSDVIGKEWFSSFPGCHVDIRNRQTNQASLMHYTIV